MWTWENEVAVPVGSGQALLPLPFLAWQADIPAPPPALGSGAPSGWESGRGRALSPVLGAPSQDIGAQMTHIKADIVPTQSGQW